MVKMVQVLMDGSNVNLKLFKKLKEQRNELGSPGLIDFGSCDLHIFMVPLNPVPLNPRGWNLKNRQCRASSFLRIQQLDVRISLMALN